MVIDSSGEIFPVFKYLNTYVPKSTMGVVYSLKFPSSALMTYSDNYIFNPNYFNRSRPKIISYLPLEELSTWHFHVTTLVALSAGKVKSTLNLRLVVIFPACLCHYIGEYFSGSSFFTRLPITIVEVHPLSNKMQTFLNFALPFIVFIHSCRIRY